MKKTTLMLAAMALFTACSSDAPDDPNEDPVAGDKYVTVNIMAQNATTRTTTVTTGDFENGSDYETGLIDSKIKDALFLFFDADGNFSQQVYRTLSAEATDTQEGGTGGNAVATNVEFISASTLVLQATEIEAKKLLVIINPTDAVRAFTYGKTLSDVQAYTEAFTNTSGPFVMSNSVYNDGKENIYAVDITSNIKSSITEASTSAVKVYIDRVNAKVRVTEAENFTYANNEIEIVDGTDFQSSTKTTITPVVLGYKLVNVPKRSYLVKNIENINWTWNWNDASLYRSYWGNTPYPTSGASGVRMRGSDEEPEIPTEEPDPTTPDDNNTASSTGGNNGQPALPTAVETLDDFYTCTFNYSEVVKENTKDGAVAKVTTFYPQENTIQLTYNNKSDYFNTQLLAVAELHYSDGTKADLVKYNGLFYKAENFKKYGQELLKEAGIGDAISVKLAPVVTTGYGEQAWQAKLVVDTEQENVYNTGKNADDAQLVLNNMGTALYWENGKCYYYLNIDHFGVVNDNYLNAIVRNHLYDITLKGVSGLGTPVYYESIKHTEYPQESYSYLNAQINILSWKVVRQESILGEDMK